MNKKLFAVAMSTIIALATPVSALAEQEIYQGDEPGTQMTLSYSVSQSYTVKIPANVKFTQNSLSSSGTVSATGVTIPSGKTLNVSVESANGLTDDAQAYKLVNGSSVIPYTIKIGEDLVDLSKPVLSVTAGNTTGSTSLSFATTADDVAKATLSGDHSDTLTFSVSVNNA
jgi:hypothetical protein